MSFSETNTADLQQTQSVIRDLDLVNREMELQGDAAARVVLVPRDCEILLRGERVKLRMLQPGDHVRLTYRAGAESAVAHVIEVHFGKT